MGNNIFESFTGLYSKSITLRNSLIPMWETKDYLEQYWGEDTFKDRIRNEYYPVLKKVLDRKHEEVITSGLNRLKEDHIIDWCKLSSSVGTDSFDDEKKEVRKQIVRVLKEEPGYKLLQGDAPFAKGGVIDDPNLSEGEKKAVQVFARFSTRLKNYNNNRENYYSADGKSTEVSFRIVDENFMTYRMNREVIENVLEVCADLKETIVAEGGSNWKKYSTVEGYNETLTQKDIDDYNEFVGIYNKCANLWLQQESSKLMEDHPMRNRRNHQLKPLYKQIGCTVNKAFQIEKLDNDGQVLEMVRTMQQDLEDLKTCARLKELCRNAEQWDWEKIHFSAQSLSEVSLRIAADTNEENSTYNGPKWNVIDVALKENWKKNLPQNLSPEQVEKRLASLEQNAYSLAYLRMVLQESFGQKYGIDADLSGWFEYIDAAIAAVEISDKELKAFLEMVKENSELRQMDITPLKNWCDSWIKVIRLCKMFDRSEKLEKDEGFYQLLEVALYDLDGFVTMYNKLRNYITQKPYSMEKLLLKFGNPQLTDGWSVDKEKDYGAFLLRRDNNYYLALYNNTKKKISLTTSRKKTNDSDYEKVVYRLFKDVSKMIPKCCTQLKEVKSHFEKSNDDYAIDSKSYLKPFIITKRMYDLNNVTYDGQKMWQKGFLKKNPDKEFEYQSAVAEWIHFCMEFLLYYGSTAGYDYSQLRPLDTYESVDQFYKDVDKILYKIEYEFISEENLMEQVKNGDIFLFQIYNKDYSDRKREGSHKNLHTLYWEALFSQANSEQGIIKLNGGAELFRRPASIKNKTIHKAGEILVNKRTVDEIQMPIPNDIYVDLCNHFNGREDLVVDKERLKEWVGRAGTFSKKINIIKDKRFTEDKYEIHIPITINYKADGISFFNTKVLQVLKNNPDVNVIGLDRGERNLITCTVVNQKGQLIYQKSFNIINNMDYQEKLAQREKERNAERVNWKSVENIKELKEGYISQVVHELIEMMLKYNAIIVMEDLNYGFKRGRFKVERQVYQKFEVALLNKLQYVVNNKTDDYAVDEYGTALHGYQLATPVDSLKNVGRQCGFVFYIPAAYTSKIDPVTGFVNVFDMTRIGNRLARKEFFSKFEDIFYDKERDVFGFSFDYNKFATHQVCARTKWTVYSVGERYVYNSKKRREELINPTERIKQLLDNQGIDYRCDLMTQICNVGAEKEDADFWSGMDYYFQTILRLRNSCAEKQLDQIISPVMSEDGVFYASPVSDEEKSETSILPNDADTNGAYHIALKGLFLLKERINKLEIGKDGKIPKEMYQITNAEWLAYRQKK